MSNWYTIAVMIAFKKLIFSRIVLILVSWTTNFYAQQNQIKIPDSIASKTAEELVEAIKNIPNDKVQVYEMALANIQKEDINSAGRYYRIGLHFYGQENFSKSAAYLRKSIKILKTLDNDKLLCSVYLKLGNSYLEDWKNQEALDAYYEALEIIQKKGSIEHEIIANSGIIIIRKRMKQLDKALEVCKHTLDLTKKSSYNNGKNHVNMLTILSEVYLFQKKYDSVLYYADQGMQISKPIDYHFGTIDFYTKKGAVFFYRDDLTKAFTNLRLAEEIMKKNNFKEKKARLNLNYFLASCHYKQKEYDTAISYLNKILSSIDQRDYRNIRVLETYRLLADCYSDQGNQKETAYWLQKHTQLQDQFLNEKDQTINKIYQQDTQELGDTIKQLEHQQEKEARFKKYSIVFSFGLLLVLISIVIIHFRKQKQNKIKFDNLIEKISRLEHKKEETPKENSKEVIIDDQKIDKVLKGLKRLEDQAYFLNVDCNLRGMAKKVKTNTTYLSKIIKMHKEKSFNDYINDLRIDYVLKRLKDDKKFRSFSIKSIAAEIGYKSDNSFTKHFKAKTGLNPSYYIKKIEKLQS